MLHALLHRKLDESNPEPQRLEDALTSTVFGTLAWMDACDLLAEWLEIPTSASAKLQVWFWPRLAFAEPDVVIRLGEYVVIVEAKYQSGRHDRLAVLEEDEDLCDQLVSQYRCATVPAAQRTRYLEDLESAFAECRLVQVFVVDARRQRRARRECDQSRRRLPPGADLRLVFWQSLFRLLADRSQAQRWAGDLRRYFELLGLDTFDGFDDVVQPHHLRHVTAWGPQREDGRLTHITTTSTADGYDVIHAWSAGKAAVGGRRSWNAFHRLDIDSMRTILGWRAGTRD